MKGLTSSEVCITVYKITPTINKLKILLKDEKLK